MLVAASEYRPPDHTLQRGCGEAADTCHVSRGVTRGRCDTDQTICCGSQYSDQSSHRPRTSTSHHGNQIIIGGGHSRSSQLVTLRWICVLYLQFDFQAMLLGLHPQDGGSDEVSTQHSTVITLPLCPYVPCGCWLLASCGDVFQLKWGM